MGRVFLFNFCSFVGFYYINILNTHLTPLSSFLGRGSNRPIAFYQKSKKAICLFRECLRKSRALLRESYTVTLLTVHFKTSASSISRHYDRFWSSRTQLLPAILRMSSIHRACIYTLLSSSTSTVVSSTQPQN